MKICNKCNTQYDDSVMFCGSCGIELTSISDANLNIGDNNAISAKKIVTGGEQNIGNYNVYNQISQDKSPSMEIIVKIISVDAACHIYKDKEKIDTIQQGAMTKVVLQKKGSHIFDFYNAADVSKHVEYLYYTNDNDVEDVLFVNLDEERIETFAEYNENLRLAQIKRKEDEKRAKLEAEEIAYQEKLRQEQAEKEKQLRLQQEVEERKRRQEAEELARQEKLRQEKAEREKQLRLQQEAEEHKCKLEAEELARQEKLKQEKAEKEKQLRLQQEAVERRRKQAAEELARQEKLRQEKAEKEKQQWIEDAVAKGFETAKMIESLQSKGKKVTYGNVRQYQDPKWKYRKEHIVDYVILPFLHKVFSPGSFIVYYGLKGKLKSGLLIFILSLLLNVTIITVACFCLLRIFAFFQLGEQIPIITWLASLVIGFLFLFEYDEIGR